MRNLIGADGFLEIECQPWFPLYEQQVSSSCDLTSAPPLKEHAVLESGVDCCGGLAEFVPEAWWQRVIRRGIDFLILDVGLIWIEIAALPVLAIGGGVTLTRFIRRKRRKNLRGVIE
jgi:hypothetical protein